MRLSDGTVGQRHTGRVTARLFVAVRPPAEVVAALGATVADPHVTLRFLGDVDDDRVAPLAGRLRAGLAGVPACDAVVGTGVRRLGPTALVVPVEGLDALAAAVRAALAGLGGDDRPFRGHLTIARRRRGVPAPDVVGPAAPLRWRVGEVVLVQSALGRGPGGTARHTDVEVVGLAGAGSGSG